MKIFERQVYLKQTKDFSLHSPRVKELLAQYPQIKTFHIRRTLKNKLCLVGINGQCFERFYVNDEKNLEESEKSLLVELGITSFQINELLNSIHLPWINKIVLEHLPGHQGVMWSRYLTFSQGGKVEIHKRGGKASKNDPRSFGLY